MTMTRSTPVFTLGELMLKARKVAGLDQAELAARLGIARNTVSNYETDRTIPPLDIAARWAAETGVSLEWLAEGCAPRDLNPEPTDYGTASGAQASVALEDELAFWQIVEPIEAVR